MDFSLLGRAKPVVAENLRNDFGAFCKAAWPHLHRGRGKQLSWTWAHDLIAEYMMALYSGAITRLIVNCPPRFAKSSIVSILFPIWCWLHDPALAFLCVSYEIDLSTNHNQMRRALMETESFRGLFGDRFQLSPDRSLQGEFSNDRGGQMMAASVNSKAMGRGGDFILLDDPLSADQAYSDAQRGEVLDWLQNMMPQRLNNPATSKIALVMQRLHQSDPTGDLLQREPGEWTLLKLPLIAAEDERWVFPISKRVVVRKAGECLDPKRFPPPEVAKRRANRLVFAGQYEQSPVPISGNLIKSEDVRYYGGRDDAALPGDFDQKIISVDSSFKDLKTSDPVAILVVGTKGPRRYLLNAVNARMDLDATEQAILTQHALFGPISAVLVEDAANGPAIISHLKEKIPGVIPRSAAGGKMSRMVASAPSWQAGNWYLDRTAAWTNELVNQVTNFPLARFDDLADAMSQGEIFLQENTHGLTYIDWMKDFAAGVVKFVTSSKPKPKPIPLAVLEPMAHCPKCGSADTEQYGSDPGARIHCFRCGAYAYPSVLGVAPCGHEARLQAVLGGGGIRCAQCGNVVWPNGPPKVKKWSRRDLPRSDAWRN